MHWIWPDSYFEESESAWMVAHKFGHLNCLSGEALGKALFGRQATRSTPKRLVDLIAAQRERGERPRAQEDVLRAYTRAEFFSHHAAAASAPHVRYCRSCLQQWFHATVYQFLGMQACPIHAEPLREGCWNCGARWSFDFVACEYRLALHCYHCGLPLAGREPRFAPLFPRARRATAALRDIDGCLRDACASLRITAQLPEHKVSLAYYANVLCAASTRPPCMDQLEIHTLPLPERRSESQYELEDFRTAARQVRAVGRRLQRLFPGCSGHREVMHRWEQWRPGFAPLKQVSLLVPGNDCIGCWAMALWRWQFMTVFSIVRSPDRFAAVFRRHRALVNQAIGFDLSDVAPIALASFGWCALAVAWIAHTLGTPTLRERLMGGRPAEGLMVWCNGPVQRCVYSGPMHGGTRRICFVDPAYAAKAVGGDPHWYTSEWATQYGSTRWGETLFELMFDPKDHTYGPPGAEDCSDDAAQFCIHS